MRLATSNEQIQTQGLRGALARCLRPAVGFTHPRDVLKDPDLSQGEKRAVLASWASDASAVQDEPGLRWLLGAPEPVPLDDVLEALQRLDRLRGEAKASGSPVFEAKTARGDVGGVCHSP